ncbi:MAG: hypothetical protein J0I32_12125 [Sphingobacteriales bacterium]|nr:hypothetical protein [Sphingobacteriales bacterium]OJW00978.1 MAG: hypothetical protein BGO52_05950 [Sphingobacteriales bacterium 44-61]
MFFYENRQEDLISKSGPEEFSKIFKEESRVVVILSRDEWSNSYYTEIERNAIIDRTAVKNEGYHFLMVIPMVQSEIPPWYPSTQIYASPFRFSIEEIAHFIEFKVTEEGGIVKPLTVKERYQNFIDRVEQKRSIINLQHEQVAVQRAKEEMGIFKDCFNNKCKVLQRNIVDKVFLNEFGPFRNRSYFGYGDYLLKCGFLFQDEFYMQIVTTQDLAISLELIKLSKNGEEEKSIDSEERVFYYTPEMQGWAQPNVCEHPTNKEIPILFRDKNNSVFYDLTNPLRTDLLIDNWFQKLLSKSTESIEKYL